MATRTDRVEADFVVVGAGSAGCAVAARLSEDTATRVVLLEAGGEDKNRWIHIPLGFGKTFADPSVNWCYQTEPDPGAADRRVFWPRGKVLGGSSSINGMVYIRGQAEDFDHWRQLGNTGWSFEDVLPYFRRSEHQVRGADAFHGMGGPPAVHPNYLASETDQRTIVAGLKLCRQILENPHLKPFIASEFQPGPAVESDEQLLDYARRRGGTVYHPTSTCKMGGDPLAVVDAELRVHGIGGLRVADASIMPTVVSGNTNAATIMIGEKAADMAR
jgi:choline dehydrogenase-like flavoprotein